MKTSEEMSKSVMEKVRAYEVHKAAVKKRVTALSVTAAALAVVIFTGAAVTGNLGMGAKSADSAVKEENDIEYGREIDATESVEPVYEYSASKSEAEAEKTEEAGEVIEFSYADFQSLLPGNSPLKNLEEKGFEVSGCCAQFNEIGNGQIANCPVYAFADFIKGKASGTVFCDFSFSGSLDEYTASKPLTFPKRNKIRCGDTDIVYSPDSDNGYVAAFEYSGALYKINAGGIDSPDELKTLLTEMLNG